MPVASPRQYRQILESAAAGGYALPAINVSSATMANAALRGLAARRSDGIISLSKGAGQFISGLSVKRAALGAACLADHVHRVAREYGVLVALHTDHCPPGDLEEFVLPLVEESERRASQGLPPLFNSHMLDASELPLRDNLELSVSLFRRLASIGLVLEMETGIIGGEEEGAGRGGPERLYTTPGEIVEIFRRMQEVDGLYLLAAAFGNRHGSYKPGVVQLRPEILAQGQAAVRSAFGEQARVRFVFHGGSGTERELIRETLRYGVVKMNIDTDTQYAFTRPVAGYIFENYAGVLKLEGEEHDKRYDPRSYLRAAEEAMAARVAQACDDLCSTGRSLHG